MTPSQFTSMGSDTSVPLTPREAASGLLGSVSMTCWIFLLVRLISMRPAPAHGAIRTH